MIHLWDGRDDWETVDIDWAGTGGDFVDEDDVHWKRPKIRRADGVWEFCKTKEDRARIGSFFFGEHQVPVVDAEPDGVVDIRRLVELQTEPDTKYKELQKKLVRNHALRYQSRSLGWLRS